MKVRLSGMASRIAAVVMAAAMLASCQDDMSPIGSSLAKDEVTITVDSIETSVPVSSVQIENGDGRNLTKLLGRIRVPEYGSLDCSFVSQLLSAQEMAIPDSIKVDDLDSIRLVLSVPRGSLTGDSLAPQQLRVYRLNKQLPKNITSSFDPAGYYDASGLMGTRSYTLSNVAAGDSAMKALSFVRIPVMLPIEFGRELFTRYRNNDPIFEWPRTFNSWFPGIYVEQNFGNGCLANITKAEVFSYWHYNKRVSVKQEDGTYKMEDKVARDSVCLLASQPEVLSSNIINYRVSDYLKQLVADGRSIITTPGGYIANIELPIRLALDSYLQHGDRLSVVSSLRMDLPATAIKNDYGLGVAPYLLMVKESEREAFFAENKLPDNETSFYAAYDSEKGRYSFGGLRKYFLTMLDKVRNGGSIEPEDVSFSLVPVYVETEVVSGYNSSTVYVTKVQPYLVKPTMTELRADKAVICFTYSTQELD